LDQLNRAGPRARRILGVGARAAVVVAAQWALIGAHAAAAEGGPNCAGAIKIATGPAKKGYSKLYDDIAAVCGQRIRMCEVHSAGGLDNLDVLSAKKADIGFAQIDTVKDLAPGNDNIDALQAVLALNWNYLHVLTRTGGYTTAGQKKWGVLPGETQHFAIQKFSDLKGRQVVLVGSAQLLGRALAQRYLKAYNLRFIDAASDKEAMAMVRSGEAQAMFSVSGMPHGVISELTANDGLTLVPFDEKLGGNYEIRKLNYKGVGVYNMPALAVQNVMLTRPFGEAKAAQVTQLRQCIADRLTDLRDGEYEPAWNEIKKLDAPAELPQFAPVRVSNRGKSGK
jgi:TRAP-type uncharacterized transport system substrate-binding protein